MLHPAGFFFFLRRRTPSLALEQCVSGILPAFLPDRYAIKILSPIITSLF